MKIGDKVKFKRGYSSKSEYETGVIIDIDNSYYAQKYGNPIKVKSDNPDSMRKKIAFKAKSIILL
jgi:hypothetical protein